MYAEELQSRLEIQNRSLHTYAKEIYENIAQILSLARLQLAGLQNNQGNVLQAAADTGKLVGKAIIDLRNLTKQASPELIIKKGFAEGIYTELNRLKVSGLCTVDFSITGNFFSLDEIKELVTFCVIQQLLGSFLDYPELQRITIGIHYGRKKVSVRIKSDGPCANKMVPEEDWNEIKKRISLIDGTIKKLAQPKKILHLIINK